MIFRITKEIKSEGFYWIECDLTCLVQILAEDLTDGFYTITII